MHGGIFTRYTKDSDRSDRAAVGLELETLCQTALAWSGCRLPTFPSVLAGPGEDIEIFVGRTEGRIVHARGPADFGWDPIFMPDGFDEVRFLSTSWRSLPGEPAHVTNWSCSAARHPVDPHPLASHADVC